MREFGDNSKNESGIKMADLNFAHVPWRAVNVQDPELGTVRARADVPVDFDGISYGCSLVETERDKMVKVFFSITPPQLPEKRLIHGCAAFDLESKKFVKATASIQKHSDPEFTLPAGSGMAMYQKLLDCMQPKANELQRTIQHVVSHDTDLGLSETKWDSLFAPTLKARGYHEINQGLWKREYVPETMSL